MEKEFVSTLACPITGQSLEWDVEKASFIVTAPISGEDEILIKEHRSVYESFCAVKNAGGEVRISYPVVKGIIVLLPDQAVCV